MQHKKTSKVGFLEVMLRSQRMNVSAYESRVCGLSENQKNVGSHQQRLLQLIPPEYIPFVLLHKTGVLKSFIDHIQEGLLLRDMFVISEGPLKQTLLLKFTPD